MAFFALFLRSSLRVYREEWEKRYRHTHTEGVEWGAPRTSSSSSSSASPIHPLTLCTFIRARTSISILRLPPPPPPTPPASFRKPTFLSTLRANIHPSQPPTPLCSAHSIYTLRVNWYMWIYYYYYCIQHSSRVVWRHMCPLHNPTPSYTYTPTPCPPAATVTRRYYTFACHFVYFVR